MKGFQQSLRPVLKQYARGSFADPDRLLLLGDYLSLFLFGLFNPSVRTLRGLCIEPGKACERKVWRRQWQRGQAYVGDRLFGQDYRVFGQLNALDCVYVLRLCEKQTTVREEEEIPLSEEDQQSGVLRQAWAGLGSRPRYRSARVRLVWG